MLEYWLVKSHTMDMPRVASAWRREQRGKLLCAECWRVRRFVKEIAIESPGFRDDFTAVSGIFEIHVFSKKMYNVLEPYLIGHNEVALKGNIWTTTKPRAVQFDSRLTLRGDETSLSRSCDGCGAVLYFAKSKGDLVQRGDTCNVTTPCVRDRAVWNVSMGMLLVNDEVADALKKARLRKVRVEKVNLVDSSPDGMEHVPDIQEWPEMALGLEEEDAGGA